MVDSASIEVKRKRRRVKTDLVDVEALVLQLVRYCGGEVKALSVLRVPSIGEEDLRRISRERDRLVKERGGHRTRLQSLLVAQGVRRRVEASLLEELDGLHSPAGYPLGEELKAEIRREYQRYRQVHEQILLLERQQRERRRTQADRAIAAIARGWSGQCLGTGTGIFLLARVCQP